MGEEMARRIARGSARPDSPEGMARQIESTTRLVLEEHIVPAVAGEVAKQVGDELHRVVSYEVSRQVKQPWHTIGMGPFVFQWRRMRKGTS